MPGGGARAGDGVGGGGDGGSGGDGVGGGGQRLPTMGAPGGMLLVLLPLKPKGVVPP